MEGLANQQDNMEIMDSSLYYKAARGEIDAFKQHPKPLNQLVTPIDKNTILHIHITSRCRFSSYPSYYYLHVKREVLSFDPSETSSVNFVKDVLRICPDLLNQPNAKDETLLHMAAKHGHEDIVKIIAEENERILQEDQEAARLMLRMVNKVKDTALHEAVRYGHLDVVKELVKRDGEFSYGANDCCETPLYLAAEKGFSMAVDQMLEACKSPAFQGPGERTALHAAVLCKDEEMTRKIVGKMRFLATKADKQGWVPLHYAAQSGCLAIVKILLEADTSAAYIANKTEEKTPLHLAAQNGQTYTMEELISRCPGCWEQVDAKGRNVLHYAVASDNKFAVYTILDDTSLSNLINEKDRDGNTPLHQHVTSYNYLKYFIGHPKVDRHAFNNRNLNPLDVILSQDGLWGNQKKSKKALETMGTKSGQRIVDREESRGENSSQAENEMIAVIKEAREAHLVVATLIATVTFAAGFTLPGGYKSDENDPEQGHAILTKDLAFKVFVISDTIALMLSSSAVFFHMFMAHETDKTVLISLFKLALNLTINAMAAMVVAFITGTYAVLSHCLGLAIAATALCCPFFFIYIYYLTGRLLYKLDLASM